MELLKQIYYLSFNEMWFIKGVICLIAFLSIFIKRKYITNKLYKAVMKLLKLDISDFQNTNDTKWLRSFEWLIIVLTLDIIHWIMLPILPLVLFNLSFKLAYMLLGGAILISIIDFTSFKMTNNKEKVIDVLDRTVIYMGFKVLKALVWIVIAVMCLDEMGYNINTLVAGLGVSGLAIALAAQDAVSNLFGCVVILLDKPFQIGDWIQTSEFEGVVEAISFRSTRIRTFQNALVVVPNSKLANSLVTNWSLMEKRKLRFNVGLTYQTKSETIKKISEEIKQYLDSLESVEKNSASVFFESMNASSLDLRVDATILRHGIIDFLSEKEKINYAIVAIVENGKASFAYPTQSIYIENLPIKEG